MQELMLRLLKDGKIVGYELVKNGCHYQDTSCPVYSDGYYLEEDRDGYYILWDSFEMGVKVGQAWIFEGDRVRNYDYGTLGTIARDESGLWIIKFDGDEDHPFNRFPFIEHAPYWDVIGNIHEPSHD